MITEPTEPELVESSTQEPRISDQTFCKLFDDHCQFDDFFVIDCRSKPEFEGGHIKTAIRCHPTESEDNIPNLYRRIWKPRVCYVFHCEFSQYRGPTAYRLFSETHKNSENNDKKLYAYVLDGGFNKFYLKHQDYCVGTYISEVETPY